MFDKIKKLRAESTDIIDDITSLREEMASLRTLLQEERDALERARKDQAALLLQLKEDTRAMKSLHSGVEKELRKWQSLQSDVSRTLSEKLEKELAEVTKFAKDQLYVDISREKALKERVEKTALELVRLQDQVEKLTLVTSTIKASDFELSAFIKDMRRENKEKLALLAEVDQLKSLMAKMKQRPKRGPAF